MKITKSQLKQIIKEELSILMEVGKDVDEEEVYEQYWKAAVEDLYTQPTDYYEDYDPNSEDEQVRFLVTFAYSHLRHALGSYGGSPRSTPQEIIKAIQEGWEEGGYEYAYTQEDY